MENTIEMKSLAGKHLLSGVDEENRKIEHYGGLEDCQCINFVLDGVTYTAIEDSSDGYRSTLDGIMVSQEKVKNDFLPVEVLVVYREKGDSEWSTNNDCEILDFFDTKNGKKIMEIGTDNSDDYYPSFVANWQPENLSINESIQ